MADVLRVSILGATQGGEVWSINPTFAVEPPGQILDYTDVLAIATAVDAITVPTNLTNKLNSAQSITGCRVEARTFAGVLEATAEHTRTPVVTGGGAGAHPQQVSMVCSLRTGFPGASGRGRLYWPATAMPLTGGTLRVSSSDVTAMLTAFQTYLSAITTAVQATVALSTLHVWSRKNGAMYQVNRLLVGDILDIQRRRRDTLSENYQSITYP